MFLFSCLSADVCLSVQVYRWITLRKHWAFALNRQHRYSQLIFSLSGAAPANHTLYESDWESNRPFIYHGQAPLCLCACACSYYNGPKLCVTLSHFLLFKSCFWETAAAVQYKPPPMLLLLDFKSEEAPNIQDVIVLSKNILVNIIISVLKVRKTFLMCNVVNLLNNLFGLLPLSMPKVHGDPHL